MESTKNLILQSNSKNEQPNSWSAIVKQRSCVKTEQEIKDNRELLKLESERNAKLQIRSMDFERKFDLSAAGSGFFGQAKTSEQTLGRSAAQLEAYNEQIGKLQQRLQKLRDENVDPDVILAQQFKLEDLEQ